MQARHAREAKAGLLGEGNCTIPELVCPATSVNLCGLVERVQSPLTSPWGGNRWRGIEGAGNRTTRMKEPAEAGPSPILLQVPFA